MPKFDWDGDEGSAARGRKGKTMKRFRGNDCPERKRDNPRAGKQFRDVNEESFKVNDNRR